MKTTSLLALMTILFANAAFAQDGSHGGETIYGTEFYSLAMQFDELTNGQYKMIQSLTVPTSIAIKPKAGPIYLEDLPSGGSKTKVDAKTNKSLRETELDTTEWVKKSCFQKVWLAVHETFIYGGQETSLSYDYSGAVVMKYKKQLLPLCLNASQSGTSYEQVKLHTGTLYADIMKVKNPNTSTKPDPHATEGNTDLYRLSSLSFSLFDGTTTRSYLLNSSNENADLICMYFGFSKADNNENLRKSSSGLQSYNFAWETVFATSFGHYKIIYCTY